MKMNAGKTACWLMLLAALHAAACADNQLKVPPSDELLIIDPKMDSERKPTPVFLESGTGTEIQIAPTVIVHRYYYSGNRDFQGPMLPGGPSVVVANHPITGEQVSLNVQLMPGAPRIRYTKQAITYDYGDRCISLDFGIASFCRPRIVYHRDTGLRTKISAAGRRSSDLMKGFVSRAQIPQSFQRWREKRSDVVLSVGDRIGDAHTRVAETSQSMIGRTPLGGLFGPRPNAGIPGNSLAPRTGIVQELSNTIPTNR